MMNTFHQLRDALVVLITLLGFHERLLAADDRLLLEKSELRGTFSDICIHPQTGDLLGTELSFISTPGGLVILFQRAEGVLLKPVLLVPKQSGLRRVEVQDPTQGEIAFVAELKSQNEMVLQFKDGQVNRNGSASSTLRRRMPIWIDPQGVAVCK